MVRRIEPSSSFRLQFGCPIDTLITLDHMLDGLGLVYVGSEPLRDPLQTLFTINFDAEIERARAYFARLGMSI